MLKQKTFIFNGYDLGVYYRTRGEVEFDEGVINRKINKFLENKELVAINTTTFVRGNNPPTSGVVYTVIYKEVE